MRKAPVIENEARGERILSPEALLANRILPEGGLFNEQRLTCANHTDEDIVLDKIGWKIFVCPKCGRDYSIGRRIAILE